LGVDGKARIGLATSENLETWIKYEGNPILDIGTSDSFESNGVAFPSVVQGTKSFKMVYGAYALNSTQFGLATSTDGKVWHKYTHGPVLGSEDGS